MRCMKEIKLGKYENYPVDYCDRCGEHREIHVRSTGNFNLCDSCAKKMMFDYHHPLP